jgi:endonuclease YncB( thermonuclease family)
MAGLCGGTCRAQEFSAKVVGVTDGDTITVLKDRTQVPVRLDGIDCPERGQAFGSRAKDFTSELAFGKVVTIRPRITDRYGRTVAEVLLPDGRSLNHELVRAGFAWWFRKYATDDTGLRRLEEDARAAKRGLWADNRPLSPWSWRNQRATANSHETGMVTGNSRTHVYHAPGCPNGASVSVRNRVVFASAKAAQEAGYRAGRDCHH